VIVCPNTSPLLVLARLDRLDLLGPATSVVLTQAVLAEVRDKQDQTLLLERLAQLIRNSTIPGERDWEAQLAAMACDPDIQEEMLRIAADFETTGADGLAGV
jgi:hypothetical protein